MTNCLRPPANIPNLTVYEEEASTGDLRRTCEKDKKMRDGIIYNNIVFIPLHSWEVLDQFKLEISAHYHITYPHLVVNHPRLISGDFYTLLATLRKETIN